MITVSIEEGGGQLYVLLTVDEGVYQNLMPIIWSNLRIYPHHIPCLGTWHERKNYFRSVGKEAGDIGLKNILIEANFSTGGALNGILACSGKLYNKTFYIYKVIAEALEKNSS